MPFYEYQCQGCSSEIEVMQSINAEPLLTCETCGEDKLRRKIFPAGMIFKGDGFYSTEYRGSDYAQAEKNDIEQTKPKSDDQKGSTVEVSSSDSGSASSSDGSSVAASAGSETSNSSAKTDS